VPFAIKKQEAKSKQKDRRNNVVRSGQIIMRVLSILFSILGRARSIFGDDAMVGELT
jgi:hypothetical protein